MCGGISFKVSCKTKILVLVGLSVFRCHENNSKNGRKLGLVHTWAAAAALDLVGMCSAVVVSCFLPTRLVALLHGTGAPSNPREHSGITVGMAGESCCVCAWYIGGICCMRCVSVLRRQYTEELWL